MEIATNRANVDMQLTKQDLKSKIEEAWEEANGIRIDVSNIAPKYRKGTCHRKRSEAWVNSLAKGLQAEFSKQKEYRVFWKGNGCNKKSFYRNEFLFDVMVGRVGEVESGQHNSNRLEYVKTSEWVIESELNNRNSRQIIVDMSKLVLAASEKKLFVASHRRGNVKFKNQDILYQCSPIAENCSGEVYFCFIEHPEHWEEKQRTPPCLYEWKTSQGWTIV